MKKKGISLITLMVTIVVLIILASIIILTLNNSGLIKDSKEAKYKSELKAFDEEIREKISKEYLEDKTIISKVISDREEIKKYSEELVKSEYIEYSYISGGELTLNKKVLIEIYGDEKAEELINWAKEARIKIDDEGEIFSEEKVQIILDENDWTRGPVNATLTYDDGDIPKGYEIQYMTNRQTKWIAADKIKNITKNCKIIARVYNKNTFHEIGLNTKEITKIDAVAPTIDSITGNESQYTNSNVTLTINGAKDRGVGLHEEPYSFDNGSTWQESNTRQYTENTANIIIKVRDKLENIYTYETTIDINSIDKTPPTIESVTGNPTDWVNTDVTLTINGAKDDKSGLHEEPYSFDNGVTWQESNTKLYTQNTSNIIVKVRDAVGNEYIHPVINITKIDKEGPSVVSVTGNPTDWVNTDVTLTINGAKDDKSELHDEPYSFDNGVTWQASNINTYTQNTSNIIVKVRDAVGNEYIHPVINITKIDKEDPTVVSVTGNPTDWVNTDVTLKINGAKDDKSQLHEEPYSFDNGVTWQESNEKLYTQNTSNIVVKVRDKVGNIYTHDVINIEFIDNQAPSKPAGTTITPDINTLTVKAYGSTDEQSGLLGYKYSIDNMEWTDPIKDGETYIFENIKSNTAKTVYVKAIDKVGNTSTSIQKDTSTNKIVDVVDIKLEYINGVNTYTDSNGKKWTKQVNVRLYHPEIPTGYQLLYKLSSGNPTKFTEILNNSAIIP